MPAAQNLYDAVAYPSLPFPNTHPNRLATMAVLHGLNPAPVERCRMLEIACGDGSNIIPMAYAIPTSEFVGFDLARSPIERGQERIRELGLPNARLFQADLMNIGAELGRFDFIAAHGLYSWVPDPVSDRLLAVCNELLTPDGIAFISYNALPGGYIRNTVRELMLDRVSGEGNVAQQVAEAIGIVELLVSVRPDGDAFRTLIEEHVSKMKERSPAAVYHDELSPAQRPVQFADFARHAASHGLQYLCEAVLPPPPDPCYRYDIVAAISEATGGDLLKSEQMLDFLRMRKYRETLLCRADRAVQRETAPESFRQLMFASPATSTPGEAERTRIFKLPGGIKMESNHPLATTLLGELERAWPQVRSFAELEPALEEMGFVLDANAATLLMRLAVSKFVELYRWKAPLAAQVSDRPRASACARQEIATRAQATTLTHATVRLEDPVARRFLLLLDGARDRAQLVGALGHDFPEIPAEEIEARMEPSLNFFLRAGFLEA
jgi:SAM-dependent methyltransferase